ncbi:MAG: hypothetical protein ACJ8CN_00500 [Gemmatimonadales bacterium]
MKRSIGVRWIAGLAFGLIAAPLSAQSTTQGAVIVQGSPNTGLADRARRTMGAQVVVVERIRGRHRWWKRSGYRVITVYSDGARFYRRPFGRTILREVVVYERGGRYYINDDQWKRHRYSGNDRRDHDGRDDDRDHHDNGNHYGWDNH